MDPNHTHFILVDTAHQKNYSGEIRFRGEFEKKLTNFSPDGKDKVPLVLLVVGKKMFKSVSFLFFFSKKNIFQISP